MLKQNLTNHFIFVLDASGSMSKHLKNVVKVTDNQVKTMAKISKDMDQETRISIYTFQGGGYFSDDTPIKLQNIVFDMDVMRFDTIGKNYDTDGGTPLMDCVKLAIEDSKDISQKYTDHAFLICVVTDGQENTSKLSLSEFKTLITNLPDNYTLSIMVPDSKGMYYAKNHGFDAGNISVWDVNSASGYEELGRTTEEAMVNYMNLRKMGVKKSSSFFQVNTNSLTQNDVRKAATQLDLKTIKLLNTGNIPEKTWISKFVENQLGNYHLGKSYYQLMKPEKIQANKAIILRDKKKGTMFNGPYVRQLINLPDYELKVSPGDYGDWDIFVQSTSVNRYLQPNTEVVTLI